MQYRTFFTSKIMLFGEEFEGVVVAAVITKGYLLYTF